MTRILVTGGAGYIGSHVCKALASSGFEPIAYDNLSRGYQDAVKWGPLEVGDVGDIGRVGDVLKRHRPQAVIHLAAYANVGESVADPLLYYQNNVSAMVTLMQGLVDGGKPPVVFSSSCATYGTPLQIPIREDHPQQPLSPYGFSKVVGEQLLAALDQSHGLRSICLRYFNVAGADPDGEIGGGLSPTSHLIPRVLAAVQANASVKIFGDDYETPDGTCVRDYVHVSDIASAHVRALELLLRGGESQTFNLANKRGYSVKEVIAVAEQVCGRGIEAEVTSRRDGDAAILIGEASRASTVLGWRPERSALEQQVRDSWNWWQKVRH